MEINIVILGFAVVTNDRAAWDTGNGSGEAIIETEFESSGIE